jgi:hypothetical protein
VSASPTDPRPAGASPADVGASPSGPGEPPAPAAGESRPGWPGGPHGPAEHRRRQHRAERSGPIVPGIPDDGIRELAIAAAALVGFSRFLDGPLIWLVAAIAFAAIAFGTLQVLGESDAAAEALGVPIESMILPAAATAAAIAAVQLVPIGLLLIPAVAVAGLLVARIATMEARLVESPQGSSAGDRQAILLNALVVAFVGFSGVAAVVPGGLPDASTAALSPLSPGNLAILAVADAVLAGLLGYRAASLRMTRPGDVLWSAATYAAVVAIAAAALRAIGLPRLLGPAP